MNGLGMGDSLPMQLYKKNFCAGYLLPTFKIFTTWPDLGKKDQNKT